MMGVNLWHNPALPEEEAHGMQQHMVVGMGWR